MRQPAILLARTIGFLDVPALNYGHIYFPELVGELVERYKFQNFPKTSEESDLTKGIKFLDGICGKVPVQQFAIWDSQIVVETLTETDDSKAVLEEILRWGAEKFRLSYFSDSIKRFAYISDVTFYSDAPMLILNGAAERLSAEISKHLTDIWKEPITYEPIILRVGHDPTARKYNIAPFTIERRGGVSFKEEKYFSEAPLPTKLHLELLEQFEREMLMSTNG
ncbi:MAG TPA: hypothetical protein VFW25_02845 [Silvibacterium sp.]|nr:hypothetical protein [Silvibacterium sp.]